MARSSECLDYYARNDLDTADIVRDGLFTAVEGVGSATIHSDMPFINPSFQRLSEKRKWLWRVVMMVLMLVNAWEWFHDVAVGRSVAAVIDAVFVLIALCVIVASFFGGGKNAIQGR